MQASPDAIGWSIVKIANRVAPVALAGLAWLAPVGCGDNAVPDQILPEATYAALCAMPRTGIDPSTGEPYLDIAGSVRDENLWLRSWIDDLYLWYSEVPRVGVDGYADPVSYFDQLKTPAKTGTGKDKDQFHFTYKTSDWLTMQSSTEVGYGAQFAVVAPAPRSVVVAYVEPGSPAEAAGLQRGDRIVAVDGVDVATSGSDAAINGGLSPSNTGEVHALSVVDRGGAAPHDITLTSASVTIQPVLAAKMLPAPDNQVGYIHVTDHFATAEAQLFDAFALVARAGATDLVLDLRYNGGGYPEIASELAFEVAGPAASAGQTFEQVTYNDKHRSIDPATGDPLVPDGFLDRTAGFALIPGRSLPTLGLARVFVITGGATCSASETLMNGLAGIGVEVIQIGQTTCGKPYGFLPEDNCGTTYFAINFQVANGQGFGDYADGFTPGGHFAGCVVADDFTSELGDPREARLAAALAYRRSGSCPPPTAAAAEAREPVIPAPPGRQNQFMRTRR